MIADLTQVSQSANAAVSLVIACTIFLHQLVTKYVAIGDRLRQLTDELRQHDDEGQRHHSLREQVGLYHDRAQTIRRALFWLAIAEFAFIVVIVLSVLDIVVPGYTPIEAAGIGFTIFGLALIAVAI